MQGTEKICAAKPVASRPLSKSSQTSSSATEKTIAIRPKTIRFRPRPSSTPEAVPLKRLQSSCIASPEKGSETNLAAELFKPSVLYRPTARVVSATKASLLANLEAFDAKRHENMNLQAPTYERNLSNRHTTSRHQNSSSYADVSQSCEPSNTAASLDMELDVKAQHHGGDKLSYDGYNWRKYGQKQVKGSEHPRSYYKCTHPRCPVKKNVERSVDGQIAEIVYKGEHNHPKPPQSLKRLATNSQAQATVSDEQGRDGNLSTVPSDWNISAAMVSNRAGSRAVNVTGDKFDRKRSTDDNEVGGANIARPDGAGSNSTTQNPTDAHISGDGFHWRKYGQKVVKGNSYPRSYYRCTDPRCNARKYVERAADEPGSLVTRYEGQHTHDVPTNKG